MDKMRNDFAVFIMVWGRPDKDWTYRSLRKKGYTGKIYLVADDLDPTRHEYKEKYGDELIIFNKKEAAKKMDSGDNTGDLKSSMYSANIIRELAREKGIKYYMLMCDDYTGFYHTHTHERIFRKTPIRNLDKIFNAMLEFYINTPLTTLAMAQGGDFIGGAGAKWSDIQLMRKAMNSFLCDVDREFNFVGRVNEDATTYVLEGSRGKLFCSTSSLCLIQTEHLSQKKGLYDTLQEWGSYIKSFMSVMYNPSSVKVRMMGTTNRRIHHFVNWENAVPKIMREEYKSHE